MVSRPNSPASLPPVQPLAKEMMPVHRSAMAAALRSLQQTATDPEEKAQREQSIKDLAEKI